MPTHSCIPNASFECVFPGCRRTFQKFRTFKSHSYCHCRRQSTSTLWSVIDLTCHVGLCSSKCENTQSFYSHLKVHIRERKEVACPFRNCDKRLKVQSSFSSHISRKHKKSSEKGLMDCIVNLSISQGTGGDRDMQIDDPGQLTWTVRGLLRGCGRKSILQKFSNVLSQVASQISPASLCD